MKANLKNYRQSPRKVRLVADLVRGKSVDKALVDLRYTTKRATEAVEKLIRSAMANSEESSKNLYIKEISVDEGVTLKRSRPVSRGRAHRINKRSSHVSVVLAEQPKVKNEKLKTKNNNEKEKRL
jgi:large subunit ribosomal protein L22